MDELIKCNERVCNVLTHSCVEISIIHRYTDSDYIISK